MSHEGGKELGLSGKDSLSIFNELKHFKTQIKEVCPQALVGFVTIPTLSFEKNIQCRQNEGKLTVSKYSSTEICRLQCQLDQELSDINSRIKFENSLRQVGHEKGCMTISLHSTISRTSKKRNRRGKLRTVVRNNFDDLYDGLHAVSHLKQKWFYSICCCVQKEIKYTVNDRASLVKVRVIPEGSGGEQENSWDFKRRK